MTKSLITRHNYIRSNKYIIPSETVLYYTGYQ